MFGRKKQDKCAVCNQPIHISYGIDENDNDIEYKSHAYLGDSVEKQNVDSLLDEHHKPITKEELKEAQSRVKKFSPNHPSLAPKVESELNPDEEIPNNVVSMAQFRARKEARERSQ
jgi:hypothetical protein